MSSLIGHLSAGAAVYFGQALPGIAQKRWALSVFMLLAVLPDFDYFALWIFKVSAEPRFTHSLMFCLAASTLVWLCIPFREAGRKPATFLALSLASCSHLLLDFLVGVHPVPILWPLPFPDIQSPIGLLPSAGHLSPTNYYLWRNLTIECGVLFPAFAFLVAVRKFALTSVVKRGAVFLPVWLAFVAWSVQVHA
jgi:inner membrane protein